MAVGEMLLGRAMSGRWRISNRPMRISPRDDTSRSCGTHGEIGRDLWRCVEPMRRSRKVSKLSTWGTNSVVGYAALAAFYAAADKVPDAKAALAEGDKTNPKPLWYGFTRTYLPLSTCRRVSVKP